LLNNLIDFETIFFSIFIYLNKSFIIFKKENDWNGLNENGFETMNVIDDIHSKNCRFVEEKELELALIQRDQMIKNYENELAQAKVMKIVQIYKMF
jgi:hypothetical protein